ncbi:MAG: tRNA-specific adenosine deaminase [Candidatus Aminicenantes bacterium RBG_16_63_16]|nr:MAG: tRNA-specific adenosine deaminase [Candidatus Aminicenantes bacterium RBG_16_63_16]
MRRTPKENPHLNFMKLAVAEASAGVRKNHGGPFGAVIVRQGKMVARAHNEVITTCDPTAHAEIVTIRKASARLKKFDLSACELYTTCEPCPMCLAAILWARIPRVYFGCTRRDAEKIGFRDNLFYEQMRVKMGAGAVKLRQLGRRECLTVFREWADNKDRVPY